MRCYKCNNVLTDNDYCLKCGADVSVYKVVVKASNTYYNAGLAKAQVRDLSGAIVALKNSLDLNKKNIKARNLLGLVYYEMGEVALALSEWVISLNFKKERNVAEAYIRKIKSSPNRLEDINQSIKKYNIALTTAKEGGEDVAIIQLKKVISTNTKFVKALLLLALLYLKKGETDRAAKMLNRVLKIDRNNTLALRYRDAMTGNLIHQEDKDDDPALNGKKLKSLSGNDIIVPRNSYKEPASGVLTVIYIILGIVIGIAIMWFLILPSKLQKEQYENSTTIKEYSEKISSVSLELTAKESENKELKTKLDIANKELNGLKGDDSDAALYTKLVNAIYAYENNNLDEAALILAELDVTQLPSENAKSLFTFVSEKCQGGPKVFYTSGVEAFKQKNYVQAEIYLLRAYKLDSSNVETLYYLAMTYLNLSEDEKAQQYIDIIHDKYSGTALAQKLDEYLAGRT